MKIKEEKNILALKVCLWFRSQASSRRSVGTQQFRLEYKIHNFYFYQCIQRESANKEDVSHMEFSA